MLTLGDVPMGGASVLEAWQEPQAGRETSSGRKYDERLRLRWPPEGTDAPGLRSTPPPPQPGDPGESHSALEPWLSHLLSIPCHREPSRALDPSGGAGGRSTPGPGLHACGHRQTAGLLCSAPLQSKDTIPYLSLLTQHTLLWHLPWAGLCAAHRPSWATNIQQQRQP